MKPMLNLEGARFQRVKLKYDEPLSSYALNCTSRPFPQAAVMSPDLVVAANTLWSQVSAAALANSTSMMKPKCAESDSRHKEGKGDWHRRKGALTISDSMHLVDACKPNSGWFAIVYAAQMCDKAGPPPPPPLLPFPPQPDSLPAASSLTPLRYSNSKTGNLE